MKQNNIGEIKYCPGCKQPQQTTCCCCGCGHCTVCDYQWRCMSIDYLEMTNEYKEIHKVKYNGYL